MSANNSISLSVAINIIRDRLHVNILRIAMGHLASEQRNVITS